MTGNNVTLLNELAQKINEAHVATSTAFDAYQAAVNNVVERAMEAGRLLILAKEHHKHGDWGAWIEKNLTVSRRMAANYMRLAREVPKLDDEKRNAVSQLSMREAIQEVATKPATVSRRADPVATLRQGEPEVIDVATQRVCREQLAAPALVESSAPGDIHILERVFGPLTGVEWSELADECSYRTGRGKNRRRVINERFMKLVAFHGVPLAEIEAAE